MSSHSQVMIIGAGPGGIAVAAALLDSGVKDIKILEKGVVGEAWLEYPSETHLLSESAADHDDNMIADVPTSDVFPNVPHPSHQVYQKYLQHIVDTKNIPVSTNVYVEKVNYDSTQKRFLITTRDGKYLTSDFLVWAGGMYSNPNENLDCDGCYVHYARMPYFNELEEEEVTVVGSANGASGIILQLARPGRVVTLVSAHPYEVPQPVDCLWKENMAFVKELEMQGLVKIVEDFRVKRIYKKDEKYVLESETGEELSAANRPILCTGFSPNVQPIKELVDQRVDCHEVIPDLDDAHQSKKTPHLYLAGVVGKILHEEGMIVVFREFGKVIAEDIRERIAVK